MAMEDAKVEKARQKSLNSKPPISIFLGVSRSPELLLSCRDLFLLPKRRQLGKRAGNVFLASSSSLSSNDERGEEEGEKALEFPTLAESISSYSN